MIDTNKLIDELEEWWLQDVYGKHKANVKKLKKPKEFSINPFLHPYLANFVYGDISPMSLAKALVLPRMMSSSITTTFGKKMQDFIVKNIEHASGSGIPGIDIEFLDQTSEVEKKIYCQVKAGPNTINSGDTKEIAKEFTQLRRKANLDTLEIATDAMVVGVLYGTRSDLSGNYLAIENEHGYPVYIGTDFWEKLTGDSNFYKKMSDKLHSISCDINESVYVQEIIKELSETEEIIKLSESTNI